MLTGFAPVVREDARLLIVGSMPSEASLAKGQYYGHPRNAFWPLMCDLLNEEWTEDYGKRCRMLEEHGIALWDVVASCERAGSLDSAIRNVMPNAFGELFERTQIRDVFANGKTAEKLFRKNVTLPDGVTFHGALASTSPAYTMPFEKKKEDWSRILAVLNRGKEEESCLREIRPD